MKKRESTSKKQKSEKKREKELNENLMKDFEDLPI